MKKKEPLLTDEEVKSLKDLGAVLLPIVKRMVSEGKAKIVDGKIVFLENSNSTKR